MLFYVLIKQSECDDNYYRDYKDILGIHLNKKNAINNLLNLQKNNILNNGYIKRKFIDRFFEFEDENIDSWKDRYNRKKSMFIIQTWDDNNRLILEEKYTLKDYIKQFIIQNKIIDENCIRNFIRSFNEKKIKYFQITWKNKNLEESMKEWEEIKNKKIEKYYYPIH